MGSPSIIRLLRNLVLLSVFLSTFSATVYAQQSSRVNSLALLSAIMYLLDDGQAPGSGELIGHWKLDENSGVVAADSSSYRFDADVRCDDEASCTPNWQAGKIAGALGFNGQTDYVSLPNPVLNNRGNITLSMWFKTAVSGRQQTLISGAERFNTNASRISLLGDGRISYYTGDRSWERETWRVGVYDDNQWHRLTIVRNDTLNEVTLYLDGASYGAKYPGMDLIDVEPQALIVGLEQDVVGGRFDLNESFVGEIDDIKVIARALPRHEVELGYENRDWSRVSVQIDRGSDDAEGSSRPDTGSWDLDFHQTMVGLRFNQIGIPAGATIEKAYLEFRSNSGASTAITIPIYGELSGNALTFSESNNISSRPRTQASANWVPMNWSWYSLDRSVDLSGIVQEIVDQNGWAMGNSMAFLFEQGPDSNRRGAITYDDRPDEAARLVVYFSGGVTDASAPAAPVNLLASSAGTSVQLTWDPANDAQSAISHYTVYRQTGGQTPKAIATLQNTNLQPAYIDTTVKPGRTYQYTVTATNNADLQSTASSAAGIAVQTVSARYAYWALNDSGGSVATESGGNGLNGQLFNGPLWNPSGKFGGALQFDGDDDRVQLPRSVLNGAKNVTVSLWIKTAKIGEQSLISGASRRYDNAFLLFLNSGVEMEFVTNNDSVSWEIDPINDDQWHHVLMIANDTNNAATLYIDGIFQGGRRLTMDPIEIDEGGLQLGQEQDSVGGGFSAAQAFEGLMDEVRVEQRALNWIEIQNQVVLDTSPPGTPSGLTATRGEGALVDLSWAAASDAETGICKYRIYRGTTAADEAFLFEVANVIRVTDAQAVNNTAYRYRVSAENCVANEGARSAVATVTSGSDAPIGLQTVSNAAWDETAVRRVLNIFAYGGHAKQTQITSWADMSPEAAIVEMLTFSKTNALLSPAEDATVNNAGSLLALQNFWGGQAPDNPMRWDKRDDYFPLYYNSSGNSTVSYSNLERTWTQAVATRGLNPFLHKMAFFLSNYQMSISEFKTRPALIREYYDTLLDALTTMPNFVDVIKTGAKHATVARAYGHENSRYYNDTQEFEGNDDFAREFFQLFFAIQGETEDPEYHENVTIKNNAKLLTGMALDRQPNAFGSDNSDDWRTAPIKFNDHIDALGNYVYNQSNHYGNCLEILHEVICGASAAEKIDALAPIAANHVESLANLPIYIINLFADDNLTEEKKTAIRAQWREANFNLLNFLRSYAISTTFNSPDTFKFLSSYDRSLMLFNRITLDNQETFNGLNAGEDAEDWLDYQGLNPFNPVHDVFGNQTGLEAADNPYIFKQVYKFEVQRNTLQKTKQLYYLDGSEVDATTWYKDWGAAMPGVGNNGFVVSEVANWLWNRLIGDAGKNLDLIAKSQLYALLARGDDFGYVAVNEGVAADRARAFTTVDLTDDVDLAALLATLGAETLPLGSTDIKGVRREANARVGQAVQFIAMLPYTFAVEGQ